VAPSGEATVEFSVQTQSLDALHAAAYRLIGTAHCQIEKHDDLFVCRLTLRSDGKAPDLDTVRDRFLDLVADENLRERIAAKTQPLRNVILSLAFGSLATKPSEQP
jgi:His-Xaa-Ser system protein HxsD